MAQAANAPLLHRFLGIGATGLAIVMVLLRVNAGPLPADDPFLSGMGYAFATISLILIAVAVLVLSRRVPERRLGQSVDEYWATPAVLAPVNLVWFVSEGAAILSIVGYFMTGQLAPAATMVMGIAVFWWLGPKMFAKP
jgi:hypothetical protein